MSLLKILPEYIENFSLTLHPEIDFVSSSFQPATAIPTGSMPLSPRPSKCIKNLVDPAQMGQNSYDPESSGVSGFNEEDYALVIQLESINSTLHENAALDTPAQLDVNQSMQEYMDLVNSASQTARNTKRFDITRFDPPFDLRLNTLVKSCVRNNLMPFYSSEYDHAQFVYTNYHTINFFTSSQVPVSSSIIYNNLQPSAGVARPYSPSGSFAIDFYINPRYTNDHGMQFKAGTIMHLSSTFAVSLVSGSGRDSDGLVSGYRILLQLSHSADIEPSKVNLDQENNKRNYPRDLIFLTPDNSLKRNNWHHIAFTWGGKSVSDGSGSIYVDNLYTRVNIPSSSILPPSNVAPSALVLGNYYSGYDNEAKFFNTNAQGFHPTATGLTEDPINFNFSHPLNAEIHDIKIFNREISDAEVKENAKFGSSNTDDLLFYVPPFFTKESPTRDVILTPFQTLRKATEAPFATNFSFGVGGRLINLPNFGREFVNGYYPRMWALTASTINTTVEDITANQYIYATGSTRMANLTFLPCDNGKFYPNFNLLRSGTIDTAMSVFTNPLGGLDLSVINIDSMVGPSDPFGALTGSLADELAFSTETEMVPGMSSFEYTSGRAMAVAEVKRENNDDEGPAPVLTIFQRTNDPSSNEVSIFDISNLYYGDKILPESLFITDPLVTGSGGKVRITLKDNGRGGLFRADALTRHPSWANVGTILYNEGIALIKSPNIPFFGKDMFELKCKGEQNIHILTVNIPAGPSMFNSSSNPQFIPLSASLDPNEYDPDFVYITGLNFHDDNLNVIMRANLAQPIKKRRSDEFMIRFKKDF